MAESDEELKSLLMWVKEESEKAGLKLNIQKAKIMAFPPDGQHQNQIDYILCSQRWRNSIQSAKTRPGADCGSDHELLITNFRLKLKWGKPLDHSDMT